jgi:hypothetical protein
MGEQGLEAGDPGLNDDRAGENPLAARGVAEG